MDVQANKRDTVSTGSICKLYVRLVVIQVFHKFWNSFSSCADIKKSHEYT